MDMHSIYQNPDIDEPRFLFVQLQQVVEHSHNRRTVSILKFRVEPVTTEFGGRYIFSNLYHTPQAEAVWIPCRQTFRFDHCDVQAAVGRWAKVFLVPSKWKETRYSSIQYVPQTDVDRQKIGHLDHLTSIDGIPWEARDADESSEHVEEAIARAKLTDYDLF